MFLTLEPAALTGHGINATLRQAAKVADITILTPGLPPDAQRRLDDAGFHMVETLTALMPTADGIGVTIDDATLAPIPLAPALRVWKAAAEVQWAGRSVILSRQIFPVFERLLEKALSRDQVASGSHVEGTTAREAKDLIRELRGAFRTAGFTDAESKALIVTVRNRGYRLGVHAADIMVDG